MPNVSANDAANISQRSSTAIYKTRHNLLRAPSPTRLDQRSSIREERSLWKIKPPRIVRAIEHVRRMRGGSQSHLMRCSDGGYYIVKFQENPQGSRILCNEMLATQIARCLGLPAPQFNIVDVSEALIDNTDELVVQVARGKKRCQPGFCFGSRYLGDFGGQISLGLSAVWDFVPDSLVHTIENVDDFAGMLVFDQWTCNSDGRQAAFIQRHRNHTFKAYMIDNGFCFGAADWIFKDSPLRGRYLKPSVYDFICGIDTIEAWINRIENGIDLSCLQVMAGFIPIQWYDNDRGALSDLICRLDRRRYRLRELLCAVQELHPQIFQSRTTNRGVHARAAG